MADLFFLGGSFKGMYCHPATSSLEVMAGHKSKSGKSGKSGKGKGAKPKPSHPKPKGKKAGKR